MATDMSWPQALVTLGLAIVASIAPTMMAYAALKQGRVNEKKTDENTALTQATAETVQSADHKTNELKTKVDEVHVLTNSNLTAVKADLEQAKDQITSLQEVIGRLVDAIDSGGKELLSISIGAPKHPEPRDVADQLIAVQTPPPPPSPPKAKK